MRLRITTKVRLLLIKDYVNLSGSEIVYNEKLDEFRVWTHAKAADIKDPRIGRLRGNMNYQGDVWNIQINPIIFVQQETSQHGIQQNLLRKL